MRKTIGALLVMLAIAGNAKAFEFEKGMIGQFIYTCIDKDSAAHIMGTIVRDGSDNPAVGQLEKKYGQEGKCGQFRAPVPMELVSPVFEGVDAYDGQPFETWVARPNGGDTDHYVTIWKPKLGSI